MQKTIEQLTVKDLLDHSSKTIRIMTEMLVKELKLCDEEAKDEQKKGGLAYHSAHKECRHATTKKEG